MAAPKFTPVGPTDVVRSYESPDFVPEPWMPVRPAEIQGRQPHGSSLGYQGPDQGYALLLAERFRDRVCLSPRETFDDATQGSLNIALKRASSYGRAPVIHDLTIAFTIWGWLDESADAEQITLRKAMFEGVHDTNFHYVEGRLLADLVPESTLRLTPEAAKSEYAKGTWRELTGVSSLAAEEVPA
jgi:hypothetical protein